LTRTTRTVCCIGVVVAIDLLFGREAPAQRRQEGALLASEVEFDRQLVHGEEHRYQVLLGRGECATVIVEQRGLDVVVRLRDGNGMAIAEVDDEIRRYGREQVDLVADAAGTYTLVIEAAPGINTSGSYTIRVATRHVATDADRALQDVRRRRTAAARWETEGRFSEARLSLETALGVAETVWGPDHLHVGVVAAQLAGVYRKLADFRSEPLYQRAIAIMDRTLGAEHPATAVVRARLALLYQRHGDRRNAELRLRQALDVIEKTMGTENAWFVSCLAAMGSLLETAGDLEEEETVVQRALSIAEKIDDTNSVRYAALLNDLGEVYRQKQDYTRAVALFQRSIALNERLLGPDTYAIATALQNLGIVARERKDYVAAVAFNMRALAIRERAVGADHPDVAHILTNLANIYRATGDYGRALDTHHRALRIWEAGGRYQRETLLSVGNIAKTYASAGDIANALAYERRSDAILEKQLALNLAIGSERQKLVFMRGMSERTDRTISLHLREAIHDPSASALAALVLLQRKGRVLDAMIDTFTAVRRRIGNARDQGLLDQLHAATTALARLALNRGDAIQPDVRQKGIKDLEARKERLEAQLADHSAEFRAHMQPVTLEAVQAAIPDDAALLEFTIFRPFDPRAERNGDAYGPPHYAAYVVRRHAAPVGVDLGAADAIDEMIGAMRQALRDPKSNDLNKRARAVHERVMQPLRASLAGATRLLISPDGALNLVPFEALVDERGCYLIEHYATSYLTSGRDLLRMHSRRANSGKPVIFADPVFGEPAVARVDPSSRERPSASASRRAVTTSDELSAIYFAPLAATAEEARAIKALFPDATLFTGQRATKTALQHVEAPRMLHIASHGFFLHDARITVQNPLVRSGLALAGANLTRGSHEDGILTALEASGLNLWGTKLVTLSACETGIGEIRNGEGVYGLRRAFVMAGAETVVMSLWRVSDSMTRQTMLVYYTGLRRGLGRGDALRQAKLAMLKSPNRQHPFYWAGFIQSGEWANLDGTR
jgi:CHAT domain-containing protein